MKLHLPVRLRKAVLACFSVVSVCTLYSGGIAAADDITLAKADSLVVDYADSSSITDLADGTLTLAGGTKLLLTNCCEGDGKTYTLLTGVGSLLDAEGNPLTLTDEKKAASLYFDTTQPGTGFWAGGWLQLAPDGTMQLVLHEEEVQEALTITTRQTDTKTYNYYEDISFRDITYTASDSPAYGGAINGGLDSTITLSNNGSVLFSGNKVTSTGSSYFGGGAIYGETITLSNNGSVTFSGNSTIAFRVWGGAIYGETITLSNNGSVTFSRNSASCSSSASAFVSVSGGAINGETITLSNNGSVTFSGNSASSSGSGDAYGGAIYGDTITLSNNGSVTYSGNSASGSGSGDAIGGAILADRDITLSNNGSVTFSGNSASGSSAIGGAIDSVIGSPLKINNNGETIFRGNYAHSTTFDANGGAIHKQYGIFSIQNNASVVFEKNYTLSGDTLRLQSIYAFDLADADKEMLVNFSAPKGGKIEFRDSINIKVNFNSASAFHLNNWYVNDAGEKVAQIGDIIFTGADATAENLKAILEKHDIHRKAATEEIRLSKTSEVMGTMQLHDGQLIVCEGAIIAAYGIIVHSSASGDSTPTLWLDNGELSYYLNLSTGKNAVTISAGSALRLSRQNTARDSTLTLSAGSTLIIDIAAAHTTTAALTLESSTLTLGGAITLQLNAAEGLDPAGRYMLLSGVSEPTDWAGNITVSGGVWTIDDLSWVNNTLYLNFPALTEATWNNQSDDRLWNVNSSVNWEQHDIDYAYKDGIGVIFGDEGAGKVTLVGTLTPASVLVNSTGNYSFEGSGSLTGGMSLTKKGSGTLSISTANSYTGGTKIEAGTVVAKHAAALGTGTVTLAGGTLEIAVTDVGNTIANTGTSTLKVAGDITHILTGTIANSGELKFSGKFQTSGLGALSTREPVTYENAAGVIDSTGGFSKSAIQGILLTSGSGTTVNSGATILHGKDILTLDSDGWATMGGEASYGSYYIGTGHEVALDAIVNKAAENRVSTTNIQLNGGKLTANRALTGTLSISGTSTLHGVNFDLGNAPLQNAGDLTLTGSFDASGLDKNVPGVNVRVDDEGNEDGASGFLREGDFTVTIVNGTGKVDSSGVTAMEYGSQSLTMDGAIGRGKGVLNLTTYLLTGNDSAKVSKIVTMAGDKLELIDMQSGTLTVDASTDKLGAVGGNINITQSGDTVVVLGGSISGKNTTVAVNGTATMSGDNSYEGGTTLNGATLTVTHANALGTGPVTLNGGTLEIAVKGVGNSIANTGTSTLKVAGDITHILTGTIANSGELTFSGEFQTSGLGALSTREPATYENAAGVIDSTGGFSKSAVQGIQLTTGSGTTVNGDATIWHGTDELTLGSDGWATKGGNVSYGSYYIGTGHEVELSAIVDKAAENQVSTTDIQLNGGKLTADRALTGTLSISGTSALHGVDFDLGNAPLQNSGDLTLTGSFDASGLDKSREWNSYVTVDNIADTDGSGFLREGDFEVTVVTGSGTVDSSGEIAVKYGSQNLTMNGAIGSGVGEMHYDTYRILSGHTASSSAIHGYDEGNGKNALITLADGGTLNADDAATETKVNATGGNINLSAGTLSGTVGGSTAVAVSGTATMSGDNSYTGGTMLNGAALTVTHANALGTGAINTTGTSSLTVNNAVLQLQSAISNSGSLTLIGNFDASKLDKSASTDVYVDVLGHETDAGSGFTRSGDFTVSIANGTVDSTGASISYKGTTLEMNSGVGLSKGSMLWGEYRILSGHEVELSAIVNKAADNQVSATDIQLNGGKLTADRALTGTLSISGTSELCGVNFNLGTGTTVLHNDGEKLTLTGSFDASGLDKSREWNSYVTVDNVADTDGSGFLREGDFEVTVVTGSGTVDSSGEIAVKYGSQNLTMNGAIGSGVGEMHYDTYRILSGHTASSSAIHGYDEGNGKNALITLADGGTLNADDAATETKVNATGGNINLSAGTLSGTVGGSTAVAVTGTSTMSGDNSYTGGTMLNGAALTVTHANALGTGAIRSTDDSRLAVEGTAPLVLSEVISNATDGELTLEGAFDASALEYHVDSDGRIDLSGNDVATTASGFAKDVRYWVQIVDGGTTLGTRAHISHRDHLSRQPLVLGTDGVASTGGFTDYTHFWLEGEDSFSVSEVAGAAIRQAGVELLGVTMRSGELTVDKSIAVNAEGGNIVLSTPAVTGESVKLSGTIANASVSSLAGAYDSSITSTMEGTSSLTVNGGTISVSGDNSYSGGTTVNGGTLVAGSNTAFGSEDVAVNDDGTLDLGACTIANRVLLSGEATLAHADGASNILLQSGANAGFANGFELSEGKSLTVGAGMAAFARSLAARVGGTVYRGALTLGGGELTLNEHLMVEGHVSFGAGTTTIVNVAGWQGAEVGTELASFSSNSGYTEESLTLRGAAAGLVLNFDAATGVLSLAEARKPDDFRPDLNRNQQEVYDTVKDIVAGGEKPEGELGELVDLISGTRNEAELRELLDVAGGSEYAVLMSSQMDGNLAHLRNLRSGMGRGWQLVGSNHLRAALELYSQRSELDADGNGRGYDRTETGGRFTLELEGCIHFNSGVSIAAGRTTLQPDAALKQHSDDVRVDFYTSYRSHDSRRGGYSGKFSVGFGTHDYDLERRVMGMRTEAQADGFSVNFMHESAYEFMLVPSSYLQVFGTVESSWNRIDGFRETGAGTASLEAKAQDAWATDVTLGLRYVQSFGGFALPRANFTLQAGVTASLGDTGSDMHLRFAGARKHGYTQSGAEHDRWGYNLGATLHLPISETAAVNMGGEAILRGDSNEWNANVGVQYAF